LQNQTNEFLEPYIFIHRTEFVRTAMMMMMMIIIIMMMMMMIMMMVMMMMIIIIIYLTTNGLSPGGSGYNACT